MDKNDEQPVEEQQSSKVAEGDAEFSPSTGSGTNVEERVEDCPKCAEHLAGWKRALADYDNLQKDLLRQREEIRERVKEGFAHDLIGGLDNFDQAVKFAPNDLPQEVQTWLVGVTHVQNQFVSVMEGLGLSSYGAVAETFDPHLHNAVDQRSSNESEGTILEIVTQGWKIGERVIRPASVIVSGSVE